MENRLEKMFNQKLTKNEIRYIEKCLNGESSEIFNNSVIQENCLTKLLMHAGYLVVDTQGTKTILKV